MRRAVKETFAWSVQATLGRRNTVRLARLLLDRARLDVPNAMATNGERLVQRQALQGTPEPIIVLDVGAHEGEWTRSLLGVAEQLGCPYVEVHAFEPSAMSYDVLRATLATPSGRHRVEAHRLALSDTGGSATLYKPHEGAGSSTLHPADTMTFAVEEVSCTTVDEYARSHGIGRIRILKSDTEGNDIAVLRGAQQLLAEHRIDIVQFEYNQCWITAGHFLREAFALLQDEGYATGKVTPRGIERYRAWDPELETFREGNYVAALEDVIAEFPQVRWWNEPGRRPRRP